MIINSALKKIILASIILMLLLLFSLFPKDREYELYPNQTVEYANTITNTHEIYLLDVDNFIGRAMVILNGKSTVDKIKEMLEIMIVDGKRESVIPNGFRAIIPENTQILNVDLLDGIVTINLSKDCLDIDKKLEERMIEAITYSLTSFTEINGVIIHINGVLLTVLPQTGIQLPSILKRDFGINKIYDIEALSHINEITIFFVNKHNESYYYVPVTKYVNDDRDKIKIIIDELSSGPMYETNLMSFLNTNAKLLSYEIQGDSFVLNFNNYLFDDIKSKKILEEVIYSIALSVGANYDVKEVIFKVENQEITKSVLGSIE